MAWYRQQFCDPSETFDTLCAVPIFANPVNETVRHKPMYNSPLLSSITQQYYSRIYSATQTYIKRSGVNQTTILPLAHRYETKHKRK